MAKDVSGQLLKRVVLVADDDQNPQMLALGAGTNTIGSTNSAVPYNESMTPLAAGASVTTTPRDLLAASGSLTRFAYFTVMAVADQAGTLFTEGSWDGAVWYATNSTVGDSVPANTTAMRKVPCSFRYNRARFTNTAATAQTKFAITSTFSAA